MLLPSLGHNQSTARRTADPSTVLEVEQKQQQTTQSSPWKVLLQAANVLLLVCLYLRG